MIGRWSLVAGRWSLVAGRWALVVAALFALVVGTSAQRGGVASFPAQQREPADPAVVAKGRSIYDTECRTCHGADLRGGEQGGSNLLRSAIVLNDSNGELIQKALQSHKGRTPASDLSGDELGTLAAYIHSVLARAPGQGAPPPGPAVELKVLVGDASAGEKYFATRCASCHSPTGDLQGIGARDLSPAELQNLWVAGGRAPLPKPGSRPKPMTTRRETTVSVTLPSGQTFEGRLERIDDFVVALTLADGTPKSFRRDGDRPKVEIRDPLETHRNLLPVYTDKDIHDVTAYLATLK